MSIILYSYEIRGHDIRLEFMLENLAAILNLTQHSEGRVQDGM